jgi:hypothetical protein
MNNRYLFKYVHLRKPKTLNTIKSALPSKDTRRPQCLQWSDTLHSKISSRAQSGLKAKTDRRTDCKSLGNIELDSVRSIINLNWKHIRSQFPSAVMFRAVGGLWHRIRIPVIHLQNIRTVTYRRFSKSLVTTYQTTHMDRAVRSMNLKPGTEIYCDWFAIGSRVSYHGVIVCCSLFASEMGVIQTQGTLCYVLASCSNTFHIEPIVAAVTTILCYSDQKLVTNF